MSNETRNAIDRLWEFTFDKMEQYKDATSPVDCGKFMAYTQVQVEIMKLYQEEENNG